LTVVYQAWTYWVFRQRISSERIPPPPARRPGSRCHPRRRPRRCRRE
ncbi:hypothetical protein, partial [Mycobacterium sp. 1081908.1]